VGIACVIEKIILAYALIQVTGYAGIALAHVISKATKNIILLVLLNKEGVLNFKAASAFVYKVALACAVATFSMIGFKYLFHYSAEGASIKKLWYLGSALFTGAAVYTLSLFALKPKFSYK
jgi:peptidoglycan biosynthesis protein MviN/MurJ (putative lipid II flippase)